MRFIAFALSAGAMLAAQGCTAASNVPDPQARIIVRFRAGTPDPADAAFRARLAASAHVSRVDLLHPMSGGAYVMTVGCADPRATATSNSSDACASAIERLRASEWVTSIENDVREKH